MKSFLLMTGSGSLVILTSYNSIGDSRLLEMLMVKGIGKFVAFEVPYELAKQRYGGHFKVVANDPSETDELRVLDYDAERILRLFSFTELGEAHVHEHGIPEKAVA